MFVVCNYFHESENLCSPAKSSLNQRMKHLNYLQRPLEDFKWRMCAFLCLRIFTGLFS